MSSTVHIARRWATNSLGVRCPRGCVVGAHCSRRATPRFSPWHRPATRIGARSGSCSGSFGRAGSAKATYTGMMMSERGGLVSVSWPSSGNRRSPPNSIHTSCLPSQRSVTSENPASGIETCIISFVAHPSPEELRLILEKLEDVCRQAQQLQKQIREQMVERARKDYTARSAAPIKDRRRGPRPSPKRDK